MSTSNALNKFIDTLLTDSDLLYLACISDAEKDSCTFSITFKIRTMPNSIASGEKEEIV